MGFAIVVEPGGKKRESEDGHYSFGSRGPSVDTTSMVEEPLGCGEPE